MATIANVATNDTFDQWRVKTNEAITDLNDNVLRFDEVDTTNVTVNGTLNIVSVNANASLVTVALNANGNVSLTGANVVVQGSNTAISSNVIMTGANTTITGVLRVNAESSFANTLAVGGSLTVARTLSVNANASVVGTFTTNSARYFDELSVITPTSLSANTNDWDPAGLNAAVAVRANSSTNVTVTGLKASVITTSRLIYFENIGTSTITLAHENSDSSTAYRFICPNNASLELLPGSAVPLRYDKTSQRWRVISVPFLAPNSVTYNNVATTTLAVSGATTLSGNTTATHITASGNVSANNLSVTQSALFAAQAHFTSSLGTRFGTNTQAAFVYSPHSMYFNVDSNASDTSEAFVFGRARTNASGGSTLLTVNSSAMNIAVPVSCASSLNVSGTITGALAWTNITSVPKLMKSATSLDYETNQNLRTTDSVSFSKITIDSSVTGASGSFGTLFSTSSLVIGINGTIANTSAVSTGIMISDSVSVGTGIFGGDISVFGNINVTGSKNFSIPHPIESLRKQNVRLRHSAIEGPNADLLYRGTALVTNGQSEINIDAHARMSEGTFELLTQNHQVFVQSLDSYVHCKARVEKNRLFIETEDVSYSGHIAWLVIAERADDSIRSTYTTDEKGRFIPEAIEQTPTHTYRRPPTTIESQPFARVTTPQKERRTRRKKKAEA